MHGDLTEYEFLEDIANVVGWYYLAVAALNVLAAHWLRRMARNSTTRAAGPRLPAIWLAVACVFAVMAVIAFSGRAAPLSLPREWRAGVNRVSGPMSICAGSLAALLVVFWLRKFFVRPLVAWTLLNGALLFFGLSLTDANFAKIVTKPDNVAIVSLIFLLGYFTWLAAYKAVRNDERLQRGEPPLERADNETVLVWPDLVYIELICMVLLTAVLIFWSIGLAAPLEEPASSVRTPNPSKAPWYFVGLQEMLYYYDPWMAGVVLPGLIILGLMAIPYLDRNPRGNGYYTIRERKFAYVTFQCGFLLLWIMLILMGTFLRGPNWSFFGVYEPWDVHKVTAQNNVTLAQCFWIDWLGRGLPQPADGAGGATRWATILLRESPGIILLLAYFCCVPLALTKGSRVFGGLRRTLGAGRYAVLIILLLIMLLLPLKMLARWTGNLQYFVAIPECFLNF